MPNWTFYLQTITVLAIAAFALLILSGFWHVLALLVAGAAILWLWRKSLPK